MSDPEVGGENEFRVHPVTRYVVTHFASDGTGHGHCRQLGEFPSIEQADEVARALAQANPGSTFQTVADRREPTEIRYVFNQG